VCTVLIIYLDNQRTICECEHGFCSYSILDKCCMVASLRFSLAIPPYELIVYRGINHGGQERPDILSGVDIVGFIINTSVSG